MTLDYEQKMEALKSLARPALYMRKPGDWYATFEGKLVGIAGNGVWVGLGGDGITPSAAVCDLWNRATKLESPELYVGVEWTNYPRRKYRWIGFMWSEVTE